MPSFRRSRNWSRFRNSRRQRNSASSWRPGSRWVFNDARRYGPDRYATQGYLPKVIDLARGVTEMQRIAPGPHPFSVGILSRNVFIVHDGYCYFGEVPQKTVCPIFGSERLRRLALAIYNLVGVFVKPSHAHSPSAGRCSNLPSMRITPRIH